jgi:hypothetical protein
MVTVNVEFWSGGSAGSPTKTNASTYRYRTDDDPDTIDNTNPCVIPDSGLNYSFWRHIALNWSGTYDEISNFRLYTDGTLFSGLGTDGEVQRGNRDSGDQGCPEASYEPATGTVGTTGDDLAANHPYYSGQTTSVANLANATSGSPITIDSSTYTTDGSSYALVDQVVIDTDASSGTKSSETYTWQFDVI